MTQLRSVPVALALLAAIGCTSARANGPIVGSGGPGADDGVPVMVENGTSRTLRIYVLEAGDELLLGRVDALSNEEMRIRTSSAAMVQLVARPSASASDAARIVSEPVQLLRGHRITWQLRESPGAAGPRASTIRIFRCGEQGC